MGNQLRGDDVVEISIDLNKALSLDGMKAAGKSLVDGGADDQDNKKNGIFIAKDQPEDIEINLNTAKIPELLSRDKLLSLMQ